MFVTLLSSLSSRIRDDALEGLRAVLPESVLLRCDLIDAQTLAIGVHLPGQAPEIRFWPVGRGCPAEAVATAAVSILAEAGLEGVEPGRAVIGMPPGASALTAHCALSAGSMGLPLAVDSVALAVEPAAVEPAMASTYPLHRAGLLPEAAGAVASGEFIVSSLAHADTVLAIDDPLWGSLEGRARADYGAASKRGMQLLRELAPHAVLNAPGRVSVLGRFDIEAASARVLPGAIGAEPMSTGGPFGTVVLRSARPLHPARVSEMLRTLSRNALWVRGQLLLGGCSGIHVVVNGAGPLLWLDPSDIGATAETVLALTGDDLDAEQCRAVFAACQMDAAEIDRAGLDGAALDGPELDGPDLGSVELATGFAGPARFLG